MSVYGFTAEGFGDGNSRLWAALGAALQASKRPFIIGADANFSAGVLEEVGWLDRMRATACFPLMPTLAVADSIIDGFILSAGLAQYIEQLQVVDTAIPGL